jgi:hypothetical protein
MTAASVVIDCTGAHQMDAPWRGTIRRGELLLRAADGGPFRRVQLPQQIRMADLTSKCARHWAAVQHQLVRAVGGGGIHIIVDFDSPIRDLIRALDAWGLARYTVHVGGTVGHVRPEHYPYLASAAEVVFADSEAERRLTSTFAGGWRDAAHPVAGTAYDVGGEDPLRVLLVAYFAGSCGAVGAKRVNYWASELPIEADRPLTVDVASAMPQALAAGTRHHFVPDRGRAELVMPFETEPEWCSRAMEREVEQSAKFSTVGYYWRYGLERYFQDRAEEFDAVIISGNPFAPFEFASWAKRRWGAAVLLDYRDPFANNPRMLYADQARQEAAYVERGYNLASDVVLVVNDDCVRLVAGPRDARVAIIPNGYDDRALDSLVMRDPRSATDVVTLAHAGSFYADRSPDALVAALTPGRQRLLHIGSAGPFDSLESASDVVEVRGGLPYAEAMATIAGADLGVVYVTDTGFETPTKIYDYLGLGLEVLIITTGPIRGGALGRALEGVPGIHWVPNRREALLDFLTVYKPEPQLRNSRRDAFSRRAGTRRLFEQLHQVVPRSAHARAGGKASWSDSHLG